MEQSFPGVRYSHVLERQRTYCHETKYARLSVDSDFARARVMHRATCSAYSGDGQFSHGLNFYAGHSSESDSPIRSANDRANAGRTAGLADTDAARACSSRPMGEMAIRSAWKHL